MENTRIKLLSSEVIGQIAAGEVVERPSAALKELVENSLDAGATAVTVEIKEGGLSSFRVTDNGCGIAPADLKMAFERHATSKIRTASDLYAVETLGFRGEALASIAAVAHVKCVTRVRGGEIGMELKNDGGVITDMREAACPEGTTFLIKDLFYNAPVRQKFMKKPAAEASLVSELMAKLILSHPEISFRYIAETKTIYFSPGDGKKESAILSVYGMDTLRLMVNTTGHMNGVLVDGFVGVGEAARGNRAHECFFLNGRAMKSALLSSAVEEACRQRVTIGRFPMCVLYLTMPFEAADVNVHPNKWEVRFQNERGVREAVYQTVYDALYKTQKEFLTRPTLFKPDMNQGVPASVTVAAPAAASLAPPAEKASAPNFAAQPVEKTPVAARAAYMPPVPSYSPPKIPVFRETARPLYTPPRVPAAHQALSDRQTVSEQLEETQVLNAFQEKPPRVIGVVFDTYILMEYQDLLLLCDQHAAHERLLYEKLVRETADSPASQALLIPKAIKLSSSDYAVYEENEEALFSAGFDLSPFGDDTVQLRGVPIVLGEPEAERCLTDALDALKETGALPKQERISRIMQMACKHAVKGGERLPMEALISLADRVLKEDIPPTCPHGRPLMITLTKTELEKRFKRIQS